MIDHWYAWLLGFGLTLLFELPLVMWLMADVVPAWQQRLAIAVFANLVTHPLVWFFFPQLPLSHLPRLTVSELWAFAAEALFYWTIIKPLRLVRASMISLAANLTSFGFGSVVIRWLT